MKKREKLNRIMALVLVGALILTMVASGLASLVSMASADLDDDLLSAENELAALQQAKDELLAEVSALESSILTVTQQKKNLDSEISITQEQITVAEGIIDDLTLNIEEKTIELENKTIELENQYEAYKTRVRVMYENGETSYLDAVLNSDNFLNMLSRIEIIAQIVEYDTNLVDSLNEAKTAIEQIKAELESSKVSQEVILADLETNKADLEVKTAESLALMNSLTSEKTASEAEIKESEALEIEMNNQIQELIDAIAAQSSGDYVGGEFTWPLPGYGTITSSFGYRTHPLWGYWSLHTGVDVGGAASGVPIVAANAGTVVTSEYSSIYGNYIMVDHGGGMMTLYAHMTARKVYVGDTVSKGETIGTVGSTGWATGPHLHFEIIKDGEYQDPMDYFS